MTSPARALASHIAQAAAINLDTLQRQTSNTKEQSVLSRTLTKTLAEGEQLSIEKGRVKAFKEGNKAWTFTNCLASLGYRFEPKLRLQAELDDKQYDIYEDLSTICQLTEGEPCIYIPYRSRDQLLVPANENSHKLGEAPSIVRSQVKVLAHIRDNIHLENPSSFESDYYVELASKVHQQALKTRRDAIQSGISKLKTLAGTAAIIGTICYFNGKK